jgi:hypothetical protein
MPPKPQVTKIHQIPNNKNLTFGGILCFCDLVAKSAFSKQVLNCKAFKSFPHNLSTRMPKKTRLFTIINMPKSISLASFPFINITN